MSCSSPAFARFESPNLTRAIFQLATLLIMAGCAPVPPVPANYTTGAADLRSPVGFLSQPRLKGRKTGTAGARLARRYIESRFKACGVTPWSNAKAYEDSFGYGRNVVGFLRGSDPGLAKEIVLVSAHYDHLGKDAKGRICPGAADNAAGIAALLDLARQFGPPEHRPKRSLLLVAFDSEEMMLFGSMAFSSEPRVERARIVAAVNMDMLGRDFFDVVEHTLFIAGTEQYPALREEIRRFGSQSGLRILPLGSDLVGPRSDHVAFQSRGIPCLFFSSGTFADYHEPGDTADKLNYADLRRSADVVRQTVLDLANGRALEPAQSPASGYAAELETVCRVLSEISTNRARAGVKDHDAKAFAQLTHEAQELSSSGQYDRAARERLVADASDVLAPYFLPGGLSGQGQNSAERAEANLELRYFSAFYLRYGPQIMAGYRGLVRQVLKYRPGLVRGMPRFDYEFYDIADEDISLVCQEPNRYVLHALANSWHMSAEVKTSKWLFKSFQCNIGSSLDPLDCTGTLEEISDFCLLRLRAEHTNAQHAVSMSKVLGRVAGATEASVPYAVLLARRLHDGGFKDENEWIVRCLRQDCADLTIEAIRAAQGNQDERIEQALCGLMADAHRRADVRAAAIYWAGTVKSRRAWSVLCDLVPDTTSVYPQGWPPMFSPVYPFSGRPVVRAARAVFERELKQSSSAQTLGGLARAGLRRVARKDLGNDPQVWQAWLQSHRLG